MHGQKDFKCKLCGKAFAFGFERNQHEKTHFELYKCDDCDKIYNGKHAINMHRKRCHMMITNEDRKDDPYNLIKDEKHNCNICPKAFSTQVKLRKHKMTHGPRNYLCKICGEKFKSKSNLEIHGLIHTSLKPFKCNVCGKCFNYAWSKSRHQSLHNPPKI